MSTRDLQTAIDHPTYPIQLPPRVQPRVFVASRQHGHVWMMVGVYATYQGAIAAAEKFADGCFTEIIPMEVQA